ncbi:hypothetical protein PsorP6_002346 [Peronosclerospora sorghi]|uniref:Uncharacterized protein n=1 Tax=Peronosclerospora sorghi TaxID=230839 RepID=A0ACC0WSL4_9STRA|nr:hypothetical protein PsorP6_002346 [Peronosclerospora sorghi]
MSRVSSYNLDQTNGHMCNAQFALLPRGCRLLQSKLSILHFEQQHIDFVGSIPPQHQVLTYVLQITATKATLSQE